MMQQSPATNQSRQARLLARRRRRRRRQFLRLAVLVLVVLTLVLGLISLFRGCSREDPPALQTDAPPQATQTSVPADTTPVTTATEISVQSTTQAPDTQPPTAAPETQAPEAEDWMLLLVNAEHPIPEGFTVRLKELRNGHHVDERIYPALQQMFDDARAEGIYPLINESYRTEERQQQILDEYIESYQAEGLSREEAEQKALTVVALPGTSEHQLGLAVDIIAEYSDDSTATWQWLRDNSWRYGFILRYPENREEITGISFEPWHFRYVGPQAAQEITQQGLCLEEYLS